VTFYSADERQVEFNVVGLEIGEQVQPRISGAAGIDGYLPFSVFVVISTYLPRFV